ncbi:MAG: hypothetical protein KBG83_00110 [Bacteroidetes bacterium]|nr:hypothetical protein [Bacteroidota bacterium]
METINAKELFDRLISHSLLLKVGEETIAIIKERTLQGEFLEGSSPGSERYSTKPAPMPLGGFIARLGNGRGNQAWKRIQRGEEPGTIWRTSSSGKIWITLNGGYKRLREIAGKESDHVTLNWSGQMMRSLSKITINDSERSVTIQFSNYETARLASYHHEGVGKHKKKRIFLGLSETELQKLSTIISSNIAVRF